LTTTFVSRHSGAIEWIREERYLPEDASIVTDYDPETTAPGDLVIGTLPAQLAARVCERGGRYQHLTLDLTPELRGKELSAADMRACNARLEEFFIQRSTVQASKTRKITHLCLVSDQSLQNLLPTRSAEIKPDRCVLLVSAEMKRKSADKRLHHALTTAGCPRVETADDAPDHDLQTIIAWATRLIARLRAETPDHRFILNLTGGNKLMSLGLLQALRPWCEAVYCDTANDRLEFLHPPGRDAIRLAPDLLNVKLYLAAQGFSVRDEKIDGVLLDRRRETTVWLAHNASNMQEFIRQLNGAARYHDPKNRDARSPNLPAARPGIETEARQRLKTARLLDERNGQFSVPARHAAYLGGGWLEEYCWAMGRELETDGLITRARFAINVKLDPLDRSRLEKHPLNELDAVFVHRNRMLVIECKTGTQTSDADKSQSILNRLEVLGEHAAGRFAEKLLLTTENNLDTTTAERARRYRVRIVKAGELRNLKDLIVDWMQPRCTNP
jgi:putative CRISPR-associated protein (TIGR02620 family)